MLTWKWTCLDQVPPTRKKWLRPFTHTFSCGLTVFYTTSRLPYSISFFWTHQDGYTPTDWIFFFPHSSVMISNVSMTTHKPMLSDWLAVYRFHLRNHSATLVLNLTISRNLLNHEASHKPMTLIRPFRKEQHCSSKLTFVRNRTQFQTQQHRPWLPVSKQIVK